MLADRFSSIHTWVFDLDNTLYPPHMRLFDQIEARMVAFIVNALGVTEDEAHHMRASYWDQHGTTLAGLMAHHGVEPMPFLMDVHDIDFSPLEPDPILAARINALPGRKIIYTNGAAIYGAKVAAARGLEGCFEAIYGVEHADFHPKPQARAFARVFGQAGVEGPGAAMFEDDARNLAVPHGLGMTTIHIAPEPDGGDHIHHHAVDLSEFLAQIVP